MTLPTDITPETVAVDEAAQAAAVKTNIVASVMEQLRATFDALQAHRAELVAPLEAARAERDDYYRLNIRLFEKGFELDNKVMVLQSDPQLNEVEQAISATAKALGGLRMNS